MEFLLRARPRDRADERWPEHREHALYYAWRPLVSGRDELEANICNAEQRLSEVLKAQDREGWRAAFKWWRSLR
jgi:hypothetical protein